MKRGGLFAGVAVIGVAAGFVLAAFADYEPEPRPAHAPVIQTVPFTSH